MKNKIGLSIISFFMYLALWGLWCLSGIEGPQWFYYAVVVLFVARDIFSFIQGQLSNG